MPQYVLDRNHNLANPDGVIAFKKGVPNWVTPNMEKHAIAVGAKRVDGDTPSPLDEEEVPATPLTTDEREAQIFAAFELLIEANDAKDFTGQGTPSQKAVERLTNMNVERSEVGKLWTKYRELKAEATQ